jgi:hypothetical protein
MAGVANGSAAAVFLSTITYRSGVKVTLLPASELYTVGIGYSGDETWEEKREESIPEL